MRINFILPGRGKKISGGFKVIYEYASQMAARDHEVRVIHTPFLAPNASRRQKTIASSAYYYGLLRPNFWQPDAWFELPRSITNIWIPEIRPEYIPDADLTVLTFWHSAQFIGRLGLAKGKKIYLVQEYEVFMTSNNAIQAKMVQGFKACEGCISISPAVSELLDAHGIHDYVQIPNGIRLDKFSRKLDLRDPQRNAIGFPWREEAFKGSEFTLRVLERLGKNSNRKIPIWCFGKSKPANLPNWVKFYSSPDDIKLEALYNESLIFVTGSDYEGWGLPGTEAMACGAALVSTDNGGVRAYATSGENSLLSPAGDTQQLLANIVNLLEDDEKRIKLASKGEKSVRKFTWDRAADSFETYLNEIMQA